MKAFSHRYRLNLFLALFCFGSIALSQNEAPPEPTRTASISSDIQGNSVQFGANTPPLNQIAGAPKAYYSQYWEFGDGNYSTEKEPKHTYKEKGDYEVKLWATNHYDNGKAPATRPQSVSITDTPDDAQDTSSMTDDIELRKNREPVPNEELVLVMSYKNKKQYVTGGKLYLFYNEEQYSANNFELNDVRSYHGEKRVTDDGGFAFTEDINLDTYYASAKHEFLNIRTHPKDTNERTNLPKTIEESKEFYKQYETLEFDNMEPNEERNIFFSLKTTPEMLKDTSAIISVRSIYVPDGNYPNHKVKDMEMEIVTSHDPNKMSSNATLMNYRLVRFKTFKFKIKFQNNGEGPARTIRLETDVPEMFDKKTIEVMDMYPECPICPDEREVNYSCLDTTYTDKQAIFTFKNIYLPGSEQKNVKEYDSTKGFVRYKVKLEKDFHKVKTRSRTAIIFDKNDPIITNYATTRFTTGMSLGAKAGYSFRPGEERESKEYFAGVTLSPYKTHRGYYQAELMVGASSFDQLSEFTEEETVNDVFVNTYEFTEEQKGNNITAYLVPASYRYNLNNFLAVAGGVQLKLDLSHKTTTETDGEYSLSIPSEGQVIRDETQDTFTRIKRDCSFANFQAGVFVGFNVGFARIGPSVGARYVYYFNDPSQQVMIHAIWKF